MVLTKQKFMAGKPKSISVSRTATIRATRASKEYKATILIAQFIIWRKRCAKIFREESKDIT